MNPAMAESLEFFGPEVSSLFEKSIEDAMQNTKVVQKWQGYVYPPGLSTECSKQRRSSRPPNPPIGGGPGQLWGPKLV